MLTVSTPIDYDRLMPLRVLPARRKRPTATIMATSAGAAAGSGAHHPDRKGSMGSPCAASARRWAFREPHSTVISRTNPRCWPRSRGKASGCCGVELLGSAGQRLRRGFGGDGRGIRPLRRRAPLALSGDVRRVRWSACRGSGPRGGGQAAFRCWSIADRPAAGGTVRKDDPLQLARFIWAIVHGIARLSIDGQLGPDADPEALTRFAVARLRTGIAAPIARQLKRTPAPQRQT